MFCNDKYDDIILVLLHSAIKTYKQAGLKDLFCKAITSR